MLCSSLRNVVFGSILFIPDRVSTADHQLAMAPKRAKRGKPKAAFEPEVVFDQLRFLTPENEQTFETLIKRRHIWGERQINLHELHPSIRENLQSRHWLSLCPPANLIREFYSNLSVHEDLRGHTVASCIRGVPFRLTRERVSKALNIPIIRTPTYPYPRSPHIDDVKMSFMDDLSLRVLTEVLAQVS